MKSIKKLFFQAVCEGNLSGIKKYLALSGSLPKKLKLINQINEADSGHSNKTALNYADENGHIEIVTFLLENGADIHVWDRNKMTPLYLAVRKDDSLIAQYLIEQGSTRFCTPDDFKILISHAASMFNLAMEELLKKAENSPETWAKTGKKHLHKKLKTMTPRKQAVLPQEHPHLLQLILIANELENVFRHLNYVQQRTFFKGAQAVLASKDIIMLKSIIRETRQKQMINRTIN